MGEKTAGIVRNLDTEAKQNNCLFPRSKMNDCERFSFATFANKNKKTQTQIVANILNFVPLTSCTYKYIEKI